MASNPVSWFEIYVKDIERAKTFYEEVFQVRLQLLPSPAPNARFLAFPGEMTAPGITGSLVQMDGVPCGGSGTLIYFHSEDCTTEQERIVPAGGTIHCPKMSIGQFGFVALAVDPDGNLFGLHSVG